MTRFVFLPQKLHNPSTIPKNLYLVKIYYKKEDGRVEGRAHIFSCENSKISTRCWTTIHKRMLDPTKKRYPKSKGTEEPNRMVGGAQSHLESNPIPTRDTRRAQTKPCVRQDKEASQRLSQTCLGVFSVSCRGTGQEWPAVGRGLWLQQTWVTQRVT